MDTANSVNNSVQDVEAWKQIMQKCFDSIEPTVIKAECFAFNLELNNVSSEIMDFIAITYSGNKYSLLGGCCYARDLVTDNLILSNNRIALLVLEGNGYIVNNDGVRDFCDKGDVIIIPHMILYRLVENLDQPMLLVHVSID